MTIDQAFDDAHRRVCLAKQKRGRFLDLKSVWIGLAYPSEMKIMVKKGYMKSMFGETPRCLTWYEFTDKGWEEYDKRYKNSPDWFSNQSG